MGTTGVVCLHVSSLLWDDDRTALDGFAPPIPAKGAQPQRHYHELTGCNLVGPLGPIPQEVALHAVRLSLSNEKICATTTTAKTCGL